MAEINVALELFGGLLCLVILFSQLLNGDRSRASTRLFLWMLVWNILYLGADGAAWYCNGTSHWLWNWGGNFLQYLLAYVLLFGYSRYLIERLNLGRDFWLLQRIIGLLCLAGLGLTVVSQFTGLFYTITPENLYVRGDGFWISHAIGILSLSLDGGLILCRRKHLPTRDWVLLLLYVLLPLLALVPDLVWQEIAFLGVGTTLTLLLVFVNVQLQQDRRLKEKDKELAEKRIAVMLSQIQPHFLYNILGSIEWLCETDPKKAQEATDELARFLRGNMDSLQSTETIPASRELEHIRCYLKLECIRFGDKLKVKYDIQTIDFFLPALSLQPLVENAVRHGVTKREEGGTIAVYTRENLREYTISIWDDGVGFDPRKPHTDGREHVGIENVRSRLTAQCGGTLTVQSQVGRGTVAVVRIPKPGRHKGREEVRSCESLQQMTRP